MKVKICGITNVHDALLCERAGADALGFIFYKKSRRYISPEKALAIFKTLSVFTTRVGVFVNESPGKINKIAEELDLNLIQLHGDESADMIAGIKRPVIKSFRVKEDFDFFNLNNYRDNFLLLDSYSKKNYGGTGEKFDWNRIPENLRHKIILAGGISENNLGEIFTHISPFAIDVLSSLEEKPGKKDGIKVKKIFDAFNRLRYQC